MEVQHAVLRLPAFDSRRHAVVIERSRPAKPPGQTLLRADIVAGKHVQPAHGIFVSSTHSRSPAGLSSRRNWDHFSGSWLNHCLSSVLGPTSFSHAVRCNLSF
jgi:hypothetical protein